MNHPTVSLRGDLASLASRWLPAALALAACVLLAVSAPAQTAVTGTIEGRVQNATSGRYLKNAEVTVAGTTLSTLTGEYGEFRLPAVPAGEVSLRVTYGGLDTATKTLTVTAGQVAQQDFTLGRGEEPGDKVVELDAFKVTAAREFNATAIATNEQRYAANIKNVVTVDAFGDVNEGNAAEMLKYLPGMAVNYIASNANTVSVRGFDPIFTGVYVDGSRVATASLSNASRAVDFFTVSTNSVARVEVTKVPTPDRPADTLGGSVNMVSLSAFEYAKPRFNYRVAANMNSQYPELKKTAGPYNEDTFKILPSADFNYILPISKNLGLVVNALTSNQFNVQRRTQMNWQPNNGGTLANPFLSQFQLQDAPANVYRHTGSVKLDWRPAPRHLLSATLQANIYKLEFSSRLLAINTGSNPASYSPAFTQGATGAGSAIAQANSNRQFHQSQHQAVLNYHFDGQVWKIEAGYSPSKAKAYFRDISNDHMTGTTTRIVPSGATGNQPLTVRLDGIGGKQITNPTIRDAAGNLVDYTDPRNIRMLTVGSNPTNGVGYVEDAHVDVSRLFNFGPVPVTLKGGVARRTDSRDNRRTNSNWTVVGPDGVANSPDDSVAALGLLDDVYFHQDNYWGYSNLAFPSTYKAYDLFKAHPEYFVEATAANLINRITGSEKFDEEITAAYLQADAAFLNNRVRVLGGVRFEQTDSSGAGPQYNPNNVFQRDAAGNLIDGDPLTAGVQTVRKPEAGAAGSVQEVQLTRKERGLTNSRSYDGFYPSLHLTVNLTDNTLLRLAYAKTIGRPDLSNLIPNATITENDNSGQAGAFPGVINTTNTGLKPWSASSYDLSLEHYTKQGSVYSVGVFQKNIDDFWGFLPANTVLTQALADEYGLPAQYLGWNIISRINVGAAKVDGFEFNVQQKLDFAFLPEWAGRFSFNLNATQLHLTGANAADFSNFISATRNLGLTYSGKRFIAKINLNHRGRQRRFGSTTQGPDGANYYRPRTYVDINAEYQITKHVSLFGVARNINNTAQNIDAYGSTTPDYAKYQLGEEFGVQFNLGVKGTF